MLYKNIFFDQKKQIFLGEKAFFFKTEMEISSKFNHNYNP